MSMCSGENTDVNVPGICGRQNVVSHKLACVVVKMLVTHWLDCVAIEMFV
jgi:hypothetical protein